jgi:hypothetical protein
VRRRQVSWLAAQRPPRPSRSVLQWSIEKGSPPTVAGAAAVLCKHAPRSLSRRQCDYRGWAHERNAAGAVTTHDATAPQEQLGKSRGDRVSAQSGRRSSVRPGAADESEARVAGILKPRQAISQCKPLRDARLPLKLKVAREGSGKEEVASCATISITDRERLGGAGPHPRTGDMACVVVVADFFAKLSRHGVILITGSLQPPVLGFGITLRPAYDLGWASGQGTQAPAELVNRPVKREQGPSRQRRPPSGP